MSNNLFTIEMSMVNEQFDKVEIRLGHISKNKINNDYTNIIRHSSSITFIKYESLTLSKRRFRNMKSKITVRNIIVD